MDDAVQAMLDQLSAGFRRGALATDPRWHRAYRDVSICPR